MVKANWSGSYPCLCHGKWSLEVNGVDVSMYIPDKLKGSPMRTYGLYEMWYFDDNFCEQWRSYENGLQCNEWIAENKYWLDIITDDKDVQVEIFNAINAEDWRHDSCGGCI